jgi:hypothetical protein
MTKAVSLLALVPISVILAISFFVLVTLRKVSEKGIRAFGYGVAVLLWVAALVIIAGGIYKADTGKPMMPCMMMGKGPMPPMMDRSPMPMPDSHKVHK